MANTAKARQAKLVKLLMEAESTTGTYEPLDANTLTVPITSLTPPSPSRGTGLIDRVATLDGYGGAINGVMGSNAWAYTIEADLHAGEGALNAPYWLQLLCACGHETTGAPDTPTAGNTTITIVPSTKEIANWNPATNNHPPCSVSLSYVQNHNETADTVMRIRSATGSMSFSFTAGEVATFSAAMVGLREGSTLLDASDPNVSALGAPFVSRPWVVKAISLTLNDGNGDPVTTAYGLSTLTFSTNMETPDFLDPTETWGFGQSPVLQNAAPTLAFSLSNSEGFDAYLANAFSSAEVFSITVEFTTTTGDATTLRFSFPRCQYQDYTLTDNGGMGYLEINARCVRNPGDPTTYSIEYVFPTT